MRMAYAEWRLKVPDLADEDEAALAERFWPGAEQPTTEAPEFVTAADGRLYVKAEAGASVEVDAGDGWRLYNGNPIAEPDAGIQLKARAVRYGYALSAEVSYPAATAGGS